MFKHDYEVHAHWQERHKDLIKEATNRKSKGTKNGRKGLLFEVGTLLIVLGSRLQKL